MTEQQREGVPARSVGEPYAILVRPYGRTWRMEVLDGQGQILDYTIGSTPRLTFGLALRSFKRLRSGKQQPRGR